MDIDRIAPELRAPLRRIPPIPLHRAWARRLARAAGRLGRRVRVAGVDLERPAPGLRVHRPRASTTGAALLWIHGGGMVLGSAAQDDRICAETAAALGIVVVATDYRLAPEHPFPAALDDCRAAWRWLCRQEDLDPARLAVGGQSAGGGLAAGLVQRLRDEGGAQQPVAQWLLCPMLDDRTAARRELDAPGHRPWTNALNRVGWGALLGTGPGAVSVPPYAAPARRADLSGLPPAWIGVGDVDLFHGEDLEYARRLAEAGVPVETVVVPGAPHGFEAWAPDSALARDYLAGAREWLAAALRD